VTRVEETPLEISLQRKIISHFKKILKRIDVLIFSDFNYGFISDEIIKQTILTAKKYGVKIAADSQSSSQIGDISRFKGVDLITPTEREARLAVKNKGDGLTVLCEKLKNKCNLKHVVLTMAEHGLLVHSDQNEENLRTDQITALNRYPIDVAGAGDSFLTTAALALSTNANIWEAAYLGNVAASVQVSKTGNVPITQRELDAQLLIGIKKSL
jgi:rfaE bifunctional protein kinase chain/domain